MKNKPPVSEPQSNSFLTTLQAMPGGDILPDLSAALQEVTRAVREHSQKGKLTLDIIVSPAGRGVGDTVIVAGEITVKLPKPERRKGIFFTTEEGELRRDNPNQPQLKLTVVPGAGPEEATAGAQVAVAK